MVALPNPFVSGSVTCTNYRWPLLFSSEVVTCSRRNRFELNNFACMQDIHKLNCRSGSNDGGHEPRLLIGQRLMTFWRNRENFQESTPAHKHRRTHFSQRFLIRSLLLCSPKPCSLPNILFGSSFEHENTSRLFHQHVEKKRRARGWRSEECAEAAAEYALQAD